MNDPTSSAPQQTTSASPSMASASASTDQTKTVKPKHPSTIELTSALGIPTKARSRRVWTREEDEKLRRLVAHWGDQRGKNSHWDQISAQFEGRTNKDCRKRWFHSLDPTLKRGRWTEDEDRILLEAYGKMGSVWNKIAQLIPGRTDDQCSKRYNDVLDPSVRDRLREWTEEEDETLLQMVETYGTQWRTISTHMKGRTGLTCRNRWRKIVAPVLPKPGKDKNNINQQPFQQGQGQQNQNQQSQNQQDQSQQGQSQQFSENTLKRKRSSNDMNGTPDSLSDIQSSNSVDMEDSIMTDCMGPPLSRTVSTPVYPISNFREKINNSNKKNDNSYNINDHNDNSNLGEGSSSINRNCNNTGSSNTGNSSGYSDPMSVVGLTRRDDYSPHTPIPESPSTTAILQQVKAASISSNMNHIYKTQNNINNNNNNNNHNNNSNNSNNNTSTTSSTSYTLSIGNSKDEIHLKNQDLDSLIKLAASMGQQVVIQQHNYIHHHHHHHHYNDGPSNSSRNQEANPIYYNRSASVASNNSSTSHISNSTNHLTPTNKNTMGNSHPSSVSGSGNNKSHGSRLSTNDVSNLSALFSELEELEVDGHEHHHFGSYPPPPQQVHHPGQNGSVFKMEEENFGFEGIPFNPS